MSRCDSLISAPCGAGETRSRPTEAAFVHRLDFALTQAVRLGRGEHDGWRYRSSMVGVGESHRRGARGPGPCRGRCPVANANIAWISRQAPAGARAGRRAPLRRRPRPRWQIARCSATVRRRWSAASWIPARMRSTTIFGATDSPVELAHEAGDRSRPSGRAGKQCRRSAAGGAVEEVHELGEAVGELQAMAVGRTPCG